MLTAPDAPPKLVKLGQPETVGVFDHHHAGVRHVDADFDDRGSHQHLDLTRAEGEP